MEIKEIQANQGKIDVVAKVVEKEEPRTFEKFGKQGSVCNAKIKDDSGEIKLTLWNEDVMKVSLGDKIHVKNGWCSEYKGERQLSSGKFGEIEIVESSNSEIESTGLESEPSKEVFTNDPRMLAQQESMGNSSDSETPELIREEELVE
jgi:replication factor A1